MYTGAVHCMCSVSYSSSGHLFHRRRSIGGDFGLNANIGRPINRAQSLDKLCPFFHRDAFKSELKTGNQRRFAWLRVDQFSWRRSVLISRLYREIRRDGNLLCISFRFLGDEIFYRRKVTGDKFDFWNYLHSIGLLKLNSSLLPC